MILWLFSVFFLSSSDISQYESEYIDAYFINALPELRFSDYVNRLGTHSKQADWVQFRSQLDSGKLDTASTYFKSLPQKYQYYYSTLISSNSDSLFFKTERYTPDLSEAELAFLYAKIIQMQIRARNMTHAYSVAMKFLYSYLSKYHYPKEHIIRGLMMYYNEEVELDIIYNLFSFLLSELENAHSKNNILKHTIVRSLLYVNHYHKDFKAEQFLSYIDTTSVSSYNKLLFDLYRNKPFNNQELKYIHPLRTQFVQFLFLERDLRAGLKWGEQFNQRDMDRIDSLFQSDRSRSTRVLQKDILFDRYKLALSTQIYPTDSSSFIYHRFKQNILTQLNRNPLYISRDQYPYFEYAICLYLYQLGKTNPKHALEEYLFWQRLIFQQTEAEKQNDQDASYMLSKSKYTLYKTIDDKNDGYLSYLEYMHTHTNLKQKSTFKPVPTDLVNQLNIPKNTVIIIAQRALNQKFFITVNHNKEIQFFTSRPKMIAHLPKDKTHFILIDNKAVLHNQLATLYFKIHKKIQPTTNIGNIYRIQEKQIKPLQNVHFYGTDKPFIFNDSLYAELFYVQDEINTLSKNITLKNSLNKNNSALDWNADIVHISGHFIYTNSHPLYNRVVTGIHHEKAASLTGYEAQYSQRNPSLVILNACYSGKKKSYSMFGAKHFGEFLTNSGVQSTLMTTNDIDDRTASILIQRFYFYVQEGYSAAESLALAKNYIRIHVNPNPEFWDVFQLYGTDIQFETEPNKIPFYLFLVLTLFFVTFFLRYRLGYI